MNRLIAPLTKYATYHRDKRNIATHFLGVPLIVVSVMVLTARPAFDLLGFMLSPMWILLGLSCLYYLRLELRMGLVMCASFGILGYLAQLTDPMSTIAWSSLGIGLFVVGWVVQFIGHYYEGKKPAFLDDIRGLIIGPLFVAAELLFLWGLRRDLSVEVERIAGPTLVRSRPAVA